MTTDKNNKLIPLLIGLLVVVVAVQSVFLAKLYEQNKTPEAGSHAESFQINLQPKSGNAPSAGGKQGGGNLSSQSVIPFNGFGFDPDAWDPFQEFRNMRQQMDQMFNDSFGRFQLSPDYYSLWGGTTFSPNIDVEEQNNNYVVRMDIPGADKSNISVKIDDRNLTVSGKIDETVEEQGKNQLRRERRSGEFTRSIQLPGPVKAGEMAAEYEDGVLIVTAPKATEQYKNSKRIEIK